MRVLIVGAGVAGPILALALHKDGHIPILVDKFHPAEKAAADPTSPFDFGDVGGGFTLLHGSLRFLRDLGLLDAVRAAGYNRATSFQWSRMDGTPIYHWNVVADKNEPELRATTQILRSTLHRLVMTQVSARGIPVLIGRALATVEEGVDAVVARFTDGSAIAADVVVGADGMHSAVRRAVFGPHLRAVADGMVGYLGVTEYDPACGLLEASSVRFFTHAKLQKRLVVVRVAETLAFWEITEYGTAAAAAAARSRSPARNSTSGASGGGASGSGAGGGGAGSTTSSGGTAGGRQSDLLSDDGGSDDGRGGWRALTAAALPAEAARLAGLVESWGAPAEVSRMVARSHRLTPLVIYDAPRLASFSQGRVVLIGDAAHGMPPHLGQGLTMAYGDAAVLAEALAKFPTDHTRAFKLYNKLRVPQDHSMSDRTHKFAEQNFPSSVVARTFGEFSMRSMAVLFNYFNLITVLSSDYKEDVAKELASHSY
ncbi:hypothetical protein DFJ73DRAFT_957285 [Zopfochytrium polystomum]|nr:hypothetical protein DFJ73DRAFT_957285 [Zopfochytrium polystomum]